MVWRSSSKAPDESDETKSARASCRRQTATRATRGLEVYHEIPSETAHMAETSRSQRGRSVDIKHTRWPYAKKRIDDVELLIDSERPCMQEGAAMRVVAPRCLAQPHAQLASKVNCKGAREALRPRLRSLL
jgi:hypothetical protein